MKKKLLNSMRVLLVAAGLCVGVSAWATTTKTLYTQNYQNETDATSWSTTDGTNLPLSLQTVSENKFIRVGNATNGRYAYTNFFDNNTAAASTFYKDYTTYTLSFDAILIGASRSLSELVVMANGHSNPGSVGKRYLQTSTSSSNWDESSNKYLFFLQNTDVTGNGTTEVSTIQKFYINQTSTTVTLPTDAWCTFTLEVTSTTVNYTITNKSTSAVLQSGSYTIPAEQSNLAQGLFTFLHKSGTSSSGSGGQAGRLDVDNISITTEVDEEVVSNPTIGAPVYAGANRTVTITGGTSSKDNTVTTYYTIDGSTPSASNNAGSFTTASEDVTITSSCTVKAITISSTDVESGVASRAVTAGMLALNAPTFTKTAYSAGSYTITIADDQSGLEFVPASTTIKYRVGTTGDFATYSSAVNVPEGKTLYAYAEADNYTTSSISTVSAKALPAMTLSWGQNFKGAASSDFQMEITTDGGAISNGIAVEGDASYYIPSEDGTTKLTNANIGFYVAYNSNGNHRRWKMYKNGTTGILNMVKTDLPVHIYNLTAGQIVKVNGSALYAGGGVLTALTAFDYGTTRYYQVNANGTGTITVSSQGYLNSIDVYNLDNEVVGSMDYTTGYWNKWNTTPVVINAGETGYYKFVNHNNGGATFQNWYLYAANNSKNYVVLRADNAQNKQTIDDVEYTGTINSFPATSDIVADLCDATVELTVSLAKVDATYTLTSTAHITKADGTEMSPDYVFTQTGLPVSSMNLFVSVENNWIEILEQAVKKSVTSAGWATYYSSNALDFSGVENLSAYTVEGASDGTLTLSDALADVPAETPVLIEAEEGTYTIPVIASSSTAVTNKLEGVHVATEKDANSIYVLMASPSVGFYKNNKAFTVGANTAYLPSDFDTSGARAFYLFGDESTDINAVQTVKVDGEYYNLSGQRVAAPQKGLYIVNGNKVIVK